METAVEKLEDDGYRSNWQKTQVCQIEKNWIGHHMS